MPIPSPPKMRDRRIQLILPMAFTTKPAMVKIKVPFKNPLAIDYSLLEEPNTFLIL